MIGERRFGRVRAGRGSRSCRRRVERLVDELSAAGHSPVEAARSLSGPSGLWWDACCEAVRQEPSWVEGEAAAAALALIRDYLPANLTESRNAETIHAAARALAAPDETALARGVVSLTDQWARTTAIAAAIPEGVRMPKAVLKAVPTCLRGQVASTLRVLGSQGNGPVQIAAALTVIAAAGGADRKRPLTRIPIVLAPDDPAEDADGVAGSLEIREARVGIYGLYPDPRTMAGVDTDEPFAKAAQNAWRTLPIPKYGRCLIWRVDLFDDSSRRSLGRGPGSIGGGSLGLPMAVGLRDLTRFPDPLRPVLAPLRRFFHGLRPRTAITGALDQNGDLVAVSGMRAKLREAERRRWRLVIPENNAKDRGQAGTPGRIELATSLEDAERRARAWDKPRIGAVAGILLLLATTGIVARVQAADAADAATELNAANHLAAVSTAYLGSNAELAEYFAVQAYAQVEDPQTRSALLQAVTDSPHLARGYDADAPVTAVNSSANGAYILAGTQSGLVISWSVGSGRRRAQFQLNGPVLSVAASADGDSVVAVSQSQAQFATIGANTVKVTSLAIPDGLTPVAAGVSPSGRYVLVTAQVRTGYRSPTLVLYDTLTGKSRSLTLNAFALRAGAVAMPSDSEAVVFDGGYGVWQRFSLPALTSSAESRVSFGLHDYGSAISADGNYISYTNAGSPTPIWRTQGDPQLDSPDLTADIGGPAPDALALSAGGSRLAEADGNVVSVAQATTPGSAPAPAPVTLTGSGPITPGTLAFVGASTDELVTASGDVVTRWNLQQYSRIGAQYPVVAATMCEACGAPLIAVAPNGARLAVVDGTTNLGTTLDVRGITPADADESVVKNDADGDLGQPMWEGSGGEDLVVSYAIDNSATIVTPGPGQNLRIVGSWGAAYGNTLHLPDPAALLTGPTPGGNVVEMNSSGTAEIRNASTGTVIKSFSGPRDMAPTTGGIATLTPEFVSVDASGSYAAVVDSEIFNTPGNARVAVLDLDNGATRTISEPGESAIVYMGEHLLIQQPSGTLQVWNSAGSALEQTLSAIPTDALASDGLDTLAEVSTSNEIELFDFPSGYLLGQLQIPTSSALGPSAVAFSADGRTLVSVTATSVGASSYQGVAVAWNLDAQDWMRIACDSAGLDITAQQWQQYAGASAPSGLTCPA